jgi:hypothetical protein
MRMAIRKSTAQPPPQLQHLAVLAAHGDVRPGGVDGVDRRRRAEESAFVFNPALALENAEDVTLCRDEEIADLLLTAEVSLRKCEHAALRNTVSLPALHVAVARRASAARDKRRAVLRKLHLGHGTPDIQTFEIGVPACQVSQFFKNFKFRISRRREIVDA